jgi:hypothetical protein
MGAEDSENNQGQEQNERDNVGGDGGVSDEIINGAENVLNDFEISEGIKELVSPSRPGLAKVHNMV